MPEAQVQTIFQSSVFATMMIVCKYWKTLLPLLLSITLTEGSEGWSWKQKINEGFIAVHVPDMSGRGQPACPRV
jgi:hypothetical protein